MQKSTAVNFAVLAVNSGHLCSAGSLSLPHPPLAGRGRGRWKSVISITRLQAVPSRIPKGFFPMLLFQVWQSGNLSGMGIHWPLLI